MGCSLPTVPELSWAAFFFDLVDLAGPSAAFSAASSAFSYALSFSVDKSQSSIQCLASLLFQSACGQEARGVPLFETI